MIYAEIIEDNNQPIDHLFYKMWNVDKNRFETVGGSHTISIPCDGSITLQHGRDDRYQIYILDETDNVLATLEWNPSDDPVDDPVGDPATIDVVSTSNNSVTLVVKDSGGNAVQGVQLREKSGYGLNDAADITATVVSISQSNAIGQVTVVYNITSASNFSRSEVRQFNVIYEDTLQTIERQVTIDIERVGNSSNYHINDVSLTP